jgi:hypothetical protein
LSAILLLAGSVLLAACAWSSPEPVSGLWTTNDGDTALVLQAGGEAVLDNMPFWPAGGGCDAAPVYYSISGLWSVDGGFIRVHLDSAAEQYISVEFISMGPRGDEWATLGWGHCSLEDPEVVLVRVEDAASAGVE